MICPTDLVQNIYLPCIRRQIKKKIYIETHKILNIPTQIVLTNIINIII